MKVFILFLSFYISSLSLASGCFSDSFYNLKTFAKAAGVDYCYPDKLEQISNPRSMSDRQYNYFSEKINEYIMIFSSEYIDTASLEFMFYPAVRKNSLTSADARKVEFEYDQSYTCNYRGLEKKLTSKIYVFGIVGLTGVCLSKKKVSW